MNIAIVSAVKWCGKVSEDLALQRALADCGHTATLVAWEDETIDWQAFDTAVLRSAWGYQYRISDFFAWIDSLAPKGVRLLNPPRLLAENIRKHRQMSRWRRANLPLIPTAFLSRRDEPELSPPAGALMQTIEAHFPSHRYGFVLKPVISASGGDTVLLDPYNALDRLSCPMDEGEALFQALLEREESIGVMLQPFYSEVSGGELALVYFGGQFSHAARRFTGVLGGEKTAVYEPTVPPEFLQIGGRVLAALGETPVYMRVDLVETKQGPVLMEVELAEPFLFLDYLPEAKRTAAVRWLAAEISSRVQQKSPSIV